MSDIDYLAKPESYFSTARREFIDRLSVNPDARLLEIGCGNGATSAYALKTHKCGTAVGVELCPEPAREAAAVLTNVMVGDAETIVLDFPPAYFDVLIMSEVLEHLRNPEAFLRRISPFLKPGATIVSGSPNVSHSSVIWMLILGRWDYSQSGIMDFTHLRWFTARTYSEMFSRVGFSTMFVGPARPFTWRKRVFSLMTANLVAHLLHSQIVYVGVFRGVQALNSVKAIPNNV